MEIKRSRVLALVCTVAGILAITSTIAVFSSANKTEEVRYLFITGSSTRESIKAELNGGFAYTLLSSALQYKPRTGRYAILPGESWLSVVRKLRNGSQEPVRLVLPSLRTMENLCAFLGEKLMVDSTSWAEVLCNDKALEPLGYNQQTIPALFIPNTYEVWWNTDVNDFLQRMKKEYDAFWTEQRMALAAQHSMTPVEIATLASIIDEETANNGEKPKVAGMYLNRLRIGMPLQADPTVKFALGDFALRRIYHEHLTVQSPYNTYLNTGLPPGPIRIASTAGINAVLNADVHPYLYMCANPDFSGTHIFAVTYPEHLHNAHLYSRALNARGIK